MVSQQISAGTSAVAERNKSIDLIKVIASISVVCLHTVNSDRLYFTAGWAIPLFMMAIGYFLFNRKQGITLQYIAGKIVRIFRFCAVWVFSLMTLDALNIAFRHNDPVSAMYMMAEIPQNVVLSMMKQGSTKVLWFCGSMVLIYLFAYIFYTRNLRAERVWLYCFCCGIAFQIIAYLHHIPVQGMFCQTFRMWTWLQYCMLGAMMPRISAFFSERVPFVCHILLLLICPLLTSFQIYAAKNLINDPHAEFFYDSISMIVIVALVFSLMLRIPNKAYRFFNPSFFAELSVGVFPIHALVSRLTVFFMRIIELNDKNNILLFVLTTVFSYAAVYVLSRTRLKKYFLSI